MNNVHDLGGLHAFGPVDTTDDGHVFHGEWERLAFGLTMAAIANGFLRNVDENRHAKERMSPASYLESSYYELWLAALEMNLVENGVFTAEAIAEWETKLIADPDLTTGSCDLPELGQMLLGIIDAGGDLAGTLSEPPRYAIGQRVRLGQRQSRRHTRLPAYARGCCATVVRVTPPFPVPDVVAHDDEAEYDWTYQVRLEADELWGDAAESGTTVLLDVWERYIVAAEPV